MARVEYRKIIEGMDRLQGRSEALEGGLVPLRGSVHGYASSASLCAGYSGNRINSGSGRS